MNREQKRVGLQFEMSRKVSDAGYNLVARAVSLGLSVSPEQHERTSAAIAQFSQAAGRFRIDALEFTRRQNPNESLSLGVRVVLPVQELGRSEMEDIVRCMNMAGTVLDRRAPQLHARVDYTSPEIKDADKFDIENSNKGEDKVPEEIIGVLKFKNE